jgi:hypothetical protein
MLDYAAVLTDLASPPGNQLEALKGKLAGFHCIRINDQWRGWSSAGPIPVPPRSTSRTTTEEPDESHFWTQAADHPGVRFSAKSS